MNPLRFETTTNGPPNIPEFGSVKTEDGFKGLLAMDAYNKVRDSTLYPAVLLTMASMIRASNHGSRQRWPRACRPHQAAASRSGCVSITTQGMVSEQRSVSASKSKPIHSPFSSISLCRPNTRRGTQARRNNTCP